MNLTAVGNTLFFTVPSTSGTGLVLWKSDGTPTGTASVFSSLTPTSELTALNGGLLYFEAGGLYRTDAVTRTKTRLSTTVKEANDRVAVAGGYMYYSTNAGRGEELYRTDGTVTGTGPVVPDGTGPEVLGSMTAVGDRVFFTGAFGTPNDEIWVSDGTATGTRLVRDFVNRSPQELTAVGDTLYFTMTDPATGRELWMTDGTDAGTGMVADVQPGATSSSPLNLTDVNGTLYFSAATTATARELWKSD